MVLIISVSGLNTSVIAQDYPPQELLSSVNFDDYQLPTGPLPEYLEPFTETISGSTITRISDKDEFGTNGQRLGNSYAKDQPWNNDGSLVKLAGYPSAILDGETYEFLFWRDIPGNAQWSNLESDYMYGVSYNVVEKYNVFTNQREVLRTFDEYDGGVHFGYGEGNLSNDDKYMGLIGSHQGEKILIVYDIQLDEIVGTRNIGPAGALDWFSVSQLGNFAVAMYGPNGSGPEEGVKSYNIDLSNEIHVHDITEHADLGIDMDGNEVIVSYQGPEGWDAGSYIFSARLDGGGVRNLFQFPGGIWGGHISCRSTDRPGWVYISEQCCPSHPVAPMEIFAIKLDDSGIIERFAKHHSEADAGYNHSTKAVPNRNGTKVIFTSNWNDSSLMAEPAAPAWVVEYPQQSLGVEENQLSEAFNVFPNPTNNIVNIKIGGSSNLITGLQLNDILGRTLINRTVDNESSMTLDLSAYPSGMYLLSVIIDGNKQTKKIIRE